MELNEVEREAWIHSREEKFDSEALFEVLSNLKNDQSSQSLNDQSSQSLNVQSSQSLNDQSHIFETVETTFRNTA